MEPAAQLQSAVHRGELLLFFTLLQLTVIVLAARLCGNLSVRFGNRFTDAAAGVASNFFEFGPGFLDDRRDFGHLLVGQSKLPL